jgi:anaerobic selenocysteine-containing dehydrogenase
MPLGESRSNWRRSDPRAGARSDGRRVPARRRAHRPDFPVGPLAGGADCDALTRARGEANRAARGFTPSGKIEIKNERSPSRPASRPTHADLDGEALPLRLQTAPALYRLNSSFTERAELSKKLGPQTLRLSPADAAARGLSNGQRVTGFNAQGEVSFVLEVTDAVPPGIAVAEGVHSIQQGNARNVNGLTSQRLADTGGGSTFYDNRIEVRPSSAA